MPPNTLDSTLLECINQKWTAPWLDHLMPLISSLGAWIPFMALAIMLLIIMGGRRGRLVVVCLLLTVIASEWGVGYPLKVLTGKLRPNEVSETVVRRGLAKAPVQFLAVFKEPNIRMGHISPPGFRGNSFPSSHVVNLTAAMMFLWLTYRGRTVLLFAIPVLVAYSRIYCGAHWPSDMPHSLLLGSLAGWGMWRLLRPLLQPRAVRHADAAGEALGHAFESPEGVMQTRLH